MRVFLKWTGIVLVVLVVVFAASFLIISSKGKARAGTVYTTTVSIAEIPVDSVMMARGAHLSRIWGCSDCHTADFSGMAMMPEGNPIASVFSSNLTSGEGGIGGTYTDDDWVRAIRYGLRPDGTPLYIMPSKDWTAMSDYDVNALVAYMKQIPPVDKINPPASLAPLGSMLAGLGEVNLWEAEHIDFTTPPNNSVVYGPTAEYGAYIAANCQGCHRPDFKGGPSLQDPSWPSPPDISATGESNSWTKEQFIAALTTGVRPDGRQMEPMQMPWTAFSHMTETELEAVFAFIRTVP